MKRKTLVGIVSVSILLVLTFLGLFYGFGGDWGLTIFVFIILAALTMGTLYLATTGRETHEKHNTLWSVVSWISIVFYVLMALICISCANNFISVRCNMDEVKKKAKDTNEKMDEFYTKYDLMVQSAETEVKKQLKQWVWYNNQSALDNFANGKHSMSYYDDSYIKTAAEAIRNLFYNDPQTEIEKWQFLWNNGNKTYYSAQLDNGEANIFSFVSDAVTLDLELNATDSLMRLQYATTCDLLANMGIDTAIFPLDMPKHPEPNLTSMATGGQTQPPFGIDLLLFILVLLTLCPFAFVKLNKVKTDNKRYSNIYKEEGFSLN